MKIAFLCLAVAGCAPAFLSAPLHAQMPSPAEMVSVEVRAVSDTDRKEIKGTSADTVTQHRTLEILLRGKPKTPETRVVKWVAFGRDLKDKDVSVLERGEFPLDLSDRGMQRMQSNKVSTTSTAAHVVSKGRGGNRNNKNANFRGSKVPASGTKYAGYGVQVREGNKILGEAYDPAGLKAQMK